MSYTRSGGKGSVNLTPRGERRQVRRSRLRPQPQSGFPRISREAIEKLLARKKEDHGPVDQS